MSAELLRRFVHGSDQAAFAEIVRLHLPLVYSSALRHVRDGHAAEDVAQHVFIDFARKAARLTSHPCLAGWFYSSTRRAALQSLRTAQRRNQRETKAHLMAETNPDAPWEKIGPVLDEALAELGERERNGVILRFFSNQDFRAVGAQLGVTENAAQKIVTRALDHLHAALTRRGITSTSAALGIALGGAPAAPPAVLTSAIVALAPTAVAVSFTAFPALLMKTALFATTAAAGFAGGIWFQSRSVPLTPSTPPSVAVATARITDAELSRLREQVRESTRRVEVVEADNARLLEAVQRYNAVRSKSTAVAPTTAAPSPAADETFYVIERGDTVTKISMATGVSVAELKALNPDVNWLRIMVGQQIRLH